MDNPNINGVEYDHTSCRFRIDGIVETRVKEITYGATRDGAQYVYGTSYQPLSQTRGQYKPKEVSLTLYHAAWLDVVARFREQLLMKRFPIIVERSEIGAPFSKDTIVGCRIKDHETSSAEGGEPATTKVMLECFYVLVNGWNPMPNFRR
jgi:hypothetical protein